MKPRPQFAQANIPESPSGLWRFVFVFNGIWKINDLITPCALPAPLLAPLPVPLPVPLPAPLLVLLPLLGPLLAVKHARLLAGRLAIIYSRLLAVC